MPANAVQENDWLGRLNTSNYDFIDVSHSVYDGLITYPGLPGPIIGDHLSREQSRASYSSGTEFHIGRIEMVANTGTYIDAPFHRYHEGMDLSALPLDSLANLEGLVVRTQHLSVSEGKSRAIDASAFRNLPVAGRAILVQTGWSRYWNTARYFEDHPFLTQDAAIFLRDSGVSLVGIDSLNIDDTSDGRRPVHSILLEAEIPVVEHLTDLNQLPVEGFRFFAVPVKIKGLGSFPVRAFGLVANTTRNDI